MKTQVRLYVRDSVLNAMPFVVVAIDKNASVHDMNERACGFFKVGTDDMHSFNLKEKIQSPRLLQELNRIKEKEVSSWLESLEGFPHTLRFHLMCLQTNEALLMIDELVDEKSAPQQVNDMGVREAIYQKVAEELAASQEQLKLALDAGKMATWEYDVLGDTFRRSVYHDELYGFYLPLGHWNFERFLSLIHDEDRERVRSHFQKAIDGELPKLNLEYRVVRPDREHQWLEMRAVAVRGLDGKVSTMRGALVDVTGLKNVEFQLQKALSIRDEFLGMASHELKNPIRTLQFYLSMSIKQVRGDPSFPKELAEKLSACLRQTKTLSRLVGDLLDVSRMIHGKLRIEIEEFDLCQVLKSLVKDLSNHAGKNGVSISLEVPEVLRVFGDPVRIEQVVGNLVSNAIQFGRLKPISIRVRELPDSVCLEVKDQGDGMSEEEKLRVFKRFERGLSHSPRAGLGLGLYICRQIVEAHRGKIWVESKLNEGSTFYVEFPKRSASS